MKKNLLKKNPKEGDDRFRKPAWQILSIILTIGAFGVLLYSTLRKQWVIPISVMVFFLLLASWPVIWDWIMFLFSKRPRSTWERVSKNLIIATLLAVIFEDFWELFVQFVRTLLKMLR